MPPPPPPPPPSNLSNKVPKLKNNLNRSKLLNEIQQGTRLNKTITNDRSAPILAGKISSKSTDSLINNNDQINNMTVSKTSGTGNIGALFVNGIPRKPSEVKIANAKSSFQKQDCLLPLSKSFQKTSLTPQCTYKKANLVTQHKPVPLKPLVQISNDTSLIKTSTLPEKIKPTLPAIPPGFNKQEMPLTKLMKRPVAPPPPPPILSTLNTLSISSNTEPQPVICDTLFQHSNKFLNLTVTKSNVSQNLRQTTSPPPPPPPRISSYIESVEQRFHFLPLSELPPPPRFIGFTKIYDKAHQQLPKGIASAH